LRTIKTPWCALLLRGAMDEGKQKSYDGDGRNGLSLADGRIDIGWFGA